MRIALGQEPRKPRKRAYCRERRRVIEHARGVRVDQLDIEAAEMFGQPRAPSDAQQIAGLKQRTDAARAPSPHKTEMPPVRARQKLGDGMRLAKRLRGEEDSFVAPVHALSIAAQRPSS